MNGRWIGLAAMAGLALCLSAAAQAPQAADPPCSESPDQPQRVSAAFGKPMNEAAELMKSGDFAAASVKVDQAAQHAVCPSSKLAVEKYRFAIAANLGKATSQPGAAPKDQ